MNYRFLIPLILFTLIQSAALSQSLSEVAKKEKERRNKVGEKAEVITEKELSHAEGDNVSSMGETAGSSEPEEVWEKKETSAYEEMKERDALKAREIREKWSVEGKEYGYAISNARNRLGRSEHDYEENCTGKKRKDPSWSFSKARAHCQRIKDRIKSDEKELRRIQSDCMDAARKLGMMARDARTSCGS